MIKSLLKHWSLLLKTSRPRFWLYLVGPVLFASGLAATQGVISLPILALLLLYFSWPANYLVYAINDLFDYETDKHNPKKHTKEFLLRPKQHNFVKHILVLIGVISVSVLILLPTASWVWLLLFWLLSVFYSAPPLRFKARPVLDAYSNFLYIVPGLVYVTAVGLDPLQQPLLLLAAALWSAGMHTYSAIPDIKEDTRAGITTTAVWLSVKKAAWFVLLNWLVAAILAGVLGQGLWWLGMVYPLLICYLLLPATNEDDIISRFEQYYWFMPWLTPSLLFVGYWYLVLSNQIAVTTLFSLFR